MYKSIRIVPLLFDYEDKAELLGLSASGEPTKELLHHLSGSISLPPNAKLEDVLVYLTDFITDTDIHLIETANYADSKGIRVNTNIYVKITNIKDAVLLACLSWYLCYKEYFDIFDIVKPTNKQGITYGIDGKSLFTLINTDPKLPSMPFNSKYKGVLYKNACNLFVDFQNEIGFGVIHRDNYLGVKISKQTLDLAKDGKIDICLSDNLAYRLEGKVEDYIDVIRRGTGRGLLIAAKIKHRNDISLIASLKRDDLDEALLRGEKAIKDVFDNDVYFDYLDKENRCIVLEINDSLPVVSFMHVINVYLAE